MLSNLPIKKQRVLLSRLLCGNHCFSCGYFVDYTGKCKLNYVWDWSEWQDFVKRHPKGTFKDIIDEMQFKECLRTVRASGIFIQHEKEFNLCDNCVLIEFCLVEEKGKRMTDIKKELPHKQT